MRNALLRGKGIVINTVNRVEGRNHIHAQGIDSTLNQQLSDGLAGLLQGCNAAVTQCLPEKLPVHGELSPSQLQHGNFSVYICYAENS